MMINFRTYNYSVMQVEQWLIAMSGGMPILIVGNGDTITATTLLLVEY